MAGAGEPSRALGSTHTPSSAGTPWAFRNPPSFSGAGDRAEGLVHAGLVFVGTRARPCHLFLPLNFPGDRLVIILVSPRLTLKQVLDSLNIIFDGLAEIVAEPGYR